MQWAGHRPLSLLKTLKYSVMVWSGQVVLHAYGAAALAPAQVHRLAGDRQVAHPHQRPALDLQGAASATRAAAGPRDRKVAAVAEASESPLPPQIQEALGELVGAAKEGLLALSVGVGLGVVLELMEAEVTEVVGPRASTIPTAPPSATATRMAR